MIRQILTRYRRRLVRARAAAAEVENQRANIEAQWPEVHELSTWARETRERNHLTALFIKSLREGSA